MSWQFGKPRAGQWIVIDNVWGSMSVAIYRPDLGWCIGGKWRGHDAVECFQACPTRPEGGSACARNAAMPAQERPGRS